MTAGIPRLSHDDNNNMSSHKLNLILCGTGTVGGTLLCQMASQQQYLLNDRRLDLRVVGVVDIFNILLNRDGIDLTGFTIDGFRQTFSQAPKSSLTAIHDGVLSMKQELVQASIEGDGTVFVDCTASYDIAELYQDFLSAGISVVCANKVAAAGDHDAFRKLKKTAVEQDVKYKYETNVGAGLPVIRTIDHLVTSGDRITGIEAVLSGTLNYIFDTISKDVTFSQAVKKATVERFAEPDPRIDLSGVDVLRKLVILARESGYNVSQEDVESHLFVPGEYFEGTVEDFWHRLPQLDEHFEKLRQEVERDQHRLKFVAKMDARDGKPKCSISLEKVDVHSPFYSLEGSNNIVILHTERYNPHPMMIRGYGAGAEVTAAGVFGDILDIANV